MKLNVYNKLMIGFGVVLLLKFVMMGMDYMFMTRTMSEAKLLHTDAVPTTKASQHLMRSLVDMETGVRSYLLSGDASHLSVYQAARQGVEADLKLLDEQAIKHPALQGIVTQETARGRDHAAFLEGLVAKAQHGQISAARDEIDRDTASMAAFRQGFTDLEQAVDKEVAEAWGQVERTEHQSQLVMWIFGFLAVVLNQGIAFYLGKQFSRNLATVTRAAEGIARGDLNQEVAISARDEFGDLAKTFGTMTAYLKEVAGVAHAMSKGDLSRDIVPKGANDQFGVAIAQMIASLREVVSRVRSSADEVGTGAEQITHSCRGLSNSSQVQAETAEQTSAAIEEMAANIQSVDKSVHTLGNKVTMLRGQSDELQSAVGETTRSISELVTSVQQVAGNVGHAHEASEAAAEAAGAGEEEVANTIAGMHAIAETMGGIRATIQLLDERSGEIGAIIEVIDDIAEQTNLLALNAAIEAARAGEAGRGFAVVADEVRKLAERSAKATGEIGTLIKGIQKETAQAVGATQDGAAKVQEGTQLASHTGQALQKIKDASTRVRVLLNEVTAATDAQSRASHKIVTASNQMAQINQQVIGAVAEMEDVTQAVAYATSEQRQGADQVVAAVENLNRSAHEAASATNKVSGAAQHLNEQAHHLQEAVAFFRLDARERTLEVRVAKPMARLAAPSDA